MYNSPDIEVYADAHEQEAAARLEYAEWCAQPAQLEATERLQAAQAANEAKKAQMLEQYGSLFSPEEQAELEAVFG